MKKTIFGVLCLAVICLTGFAVPAHASTITVTAGSLGQCPTVGAATSCALVYRFNADGSVDTLIDPTISSTDGIEDTLAGVQNNTTHSIDSISLNGFGISGLGIFDFDFDGQSPIANPGTGPGDTYFGQYTGAAGLGTTFFTNVGGPGNSSGTVNFPGLTAGGSGWFVLEDQISFSAPPTVGGVPEPASLALLGSGFAGLLGLKRRKLI